MARMFGVRGRTARQRADGLLEAVGLSEKSRRLARTLSGGMQRRLNIVLALVHEPDLVVLDEPQAGLDPQSRVMVRDYIRSLAGRMTVVLTTHDMEEADKLSTRVAIMDRGRLLALDTPENLKSSSAISRVVEVRPTPATVGGVEPLLSDPGARGLGLTWKDGMLSFGSRSVAGDLQLLMSLLQKAGVAAEDLRVRGRTLEDVFIGLTGKGLRE
jgi:ABC-2 type transport system ATP-binding protein